MAIEAFERSSEPINFPQEKPKTPAEKLLEVSSKQSAEAFVEDFRANLKKGLKKQHLGDTDGLSKMHLADLVYDLAPERNPDYNGDMGSAKRSIELVSEAMEARFGNVASLDRRSDRYVERVAEGAKYRENMERNNVITLYSAPPPLS